MRYDRKSSHSHGKGVLYAISKIYTIINLSLLFQYYELNQFFKYFTTKRKNTKNSSKKRKKKLEKDNI